MSDDEERTESKRSELIASLLRELRRQGIRDERVLQAMANVPRDRFLGDIELERAWANIALPIGAGQTISQPYVVALMTTTLQTAPGDRVLEVGTGSGYQTAILAELDLQVFSIERHEDLARSARSRCDELGYDTVEFRVGDGSLGWPEEAPFDAIIVTAGAPKVPAALLDQLDPDGGRMVVPVGEPDNQLLLIVTRHDRRFEEQSLGAVRFVPLIGEDGWVVPPVVSVSEEPAP